MREKNTTPPSAAELSEVLSGVVVRDHARIAHHGVYGGGSLGMELGSRGPDARRFGRASSKPSTGSETWHITLCRSLHAGGRLDDPGDSFKPPLIVSSRNSFTVPPSFRPIAGGNSQDVAGPAAIHDFHTPTNTTTINHLSTPTTKALDHPSTRHIIPSFSSNKTTAARESRTPNPAGTQRVTVLVSVMTPSHIQDMAITQHNYSLPRDHPLRSELSLQHLMLAPRGFPS
ncbi:hypothetical protein FZEAL_10366 [Fusarium zealandicum]|uniref:Uncharacterized protein n=1 Tax=Fusarium zealandicum TaxID=1053134 RepID=A0A8H4XB48_9HYPO|nr:hypothetical protein FZEAL_10366 [Fusarium zealandicum]